MAKAEIAQDELFSPLLQCFQMSSSADALKCVCILERVNDVYLFPSNSHDISVFNYTPNVFLDFANCCFVKQNNENTDYSKILIYIFIRMI